MGEAFPLVFERSVPTSVAISASAHRSRITTMPGGEVTGSRTRGKKTCGAAAIDREKRKTMLIAPENTLPASTPCEGGH